MDADAHQALFCINLSKNQVPVFVKVWTTPTSNSKQIEPWAFETSPKLLSQRQNEYTVLG